MPTSPCLRILVAINPSASFGRHRPVGPAVTAALEKAGHDVVPLQRESQEALETAVRSELETTTVDALVVVGGDGMVSFGVGLVAETGVPLGLVPSGTGNDMARALGLPFDDPARAIERLVELLREAPRPVDLLRVTRDGAEPTWVAGGVSAGFDAFVNERANRIRRPRGRARYDLALVLELLRLRQVEYDVVVDGVASRVAGTLVSVGNARSVGGGITLLPDAVIDDGFLDVLIVERLSRVGFLRLFPRVAKGTHGDDPRVRLSRARRVSIAARDVVAYGDGERIGALPVTIEVVPAALRVFAPPAEPAHSA
ncbi:MULTISPECIES: diacylglycerol kinase family protein [unclassified Frondihabitans]|uniref:diacylglycerol/lipid kinase family protein n=1 Tax=unclassified Frondihabitans TaxID=2626248 RepID=UPI000F5143F4|nr:MULTISPECIES: diacylglycerol kinase family protein [unclassified Frondihabitans]RPE76565.1 diacylglycerol kinase [Frondihabitans sp. PhB153]RPF05160.1 diacylglycerol kinase [Frondihabitans sp. PhB161]